MVRHESHDTDAGSVGGDGGSRSLRWEHSSAGDGRRNPPSTSPETSSLPSGPEPAPSADVAVGIKAFDAGNFAEARKSFEAASTKDPRNYEAFFNLGQACEKLGDKTAAEAAYKAALAIKPDLDTAAAALSTLFVDAGRITTTPSRWPRPGWRNIPEAQRCTRTWAWGPGHAGRCRTRRSRSWRRQSRRSPANPMGHLTLAHWLNAWHVRGATPHLELRARDAVKDNYAHDRASIGFEYRMAGEFDSFVKMFNRAGRPRRTAARFAPSGPCASSG